MALSGTESIVYETASGSVVSAGVTPSLAVAMLAGANPARAVNAVSNGSGTTLSAAALVAGVINRTGPSAAFTDTTDTAANLIAALPANTPTSTTWLLFIRNLTAFAETLSGGAGVTMTGNTVVPANSVYIAMMSYTGPATMSLVGLATVPFDLGALEANTAISTVGAGTLTAAGIVGGVITRSGSTAAYSDATDTAANIIAALPNANVGQSWEFSIVNTVAFAETITAGSGVTLSGLAGPIPGNATGRYLVSYTGASAVTMQLISVVYNAASGYDPSNVQTQMGASTATFNEEGNLNVQLSSAGVNPGATAADNVIAAFTVPASVFDKLARGLTITGWGSFGATGNNKRVKIIVNPTTAVVGSTVGTGGTTVADTGTVTTNGGGWMISGNVFKYGAAGSNTQLATSNGAWGGGAHLGGSAPATMAATESGSILVAITGNATTATTDIAFNQLVITGQN
jgi:hypothetical protein